MLSTLSNMEMEIDSFINRIDIFWDEYELREVKKYILIRKRYSVPMNIRDGMVIYDGLDTMCSDVNIKNGDLYYYRLFICFSDDKYSNDIISDSKCVIKAIGFTNETDYGIDIYNTFPEQIKYDDVKQKPSLPLKRFMQIIAFSFNRIETYTNTMLQQMDIDKCDEIYLPYMAKWIGLDYNEHLGADMNRLIIKTWNEIKPYMNTSNGIRYLLQRMFRAECDIKMDNDVVIDIKFVGDNNIWLLRYVTYIKSLIQKFCNYSINYDFTIHIIDTVEKYTIGWDNYYLDILHELFDDYFNFELYDTHVLDIIKEKNIEQYNNLRIQSSIFEKIKHLLYDDYEASLIDFIFEIIKDTHTETKSGYIEVSSDFVSETVEEIRYSNYINGITNNVKSLINKNFYICGYDIGDYDILCDKFLVSYNEKYKQTVLDEITKCNLEEQIYETIITNYVDNNYDNIGDYFLEHCILNIKDKSNDKFKTIYLEQLTKKYNNEFLNSFVKDDYSEKLCNVMYEYIYTHITEILDEIYQKPAIDGIIENIISIDIFKHNFIDDSELVKMIYIETSNLKYEDTYNEDDKAIYNYERWGFTNDVTGLICGTFYTCDNII